MQRESIYTDKAPKPNNSYVQAVKANGFVFVTGQVSRDPATGDFVDGTFEEQFRRCCGNLKAILEASGSSFEKCVKLTIFMTSHDDLDTMNAVLHELFPNPPARSSFGTGFLWKKCKVMIEATAVCD